MANVEQMIKYKFKNPQLLKSALTHSSVSSNVAKNYERLELLGDRMLGVSVASMLYEMFPNEPEGNLSQRFTALVCKETVADVAKNIGLDKAMFVADDEIRQNENVLCDVCEAVIGAIYVDSGMDEAFAFVKDYWQDLVGKHIAPPKDAKTTLQEVAHVKGYLPPIYKVVDRSGLEHEPIFTVEVSLGKDLKALGKGHNKKLAEFAAASKILEQINND